MKVDPRIVGLVLIAGGILTAGAYVAFNAERNDRGRLDAGAPKAVSPPPSLPASHPKLPPSHPPLAGPRPPGAAMSREGKLPASSSEGAFTHFRIGNHSVRTIYADGRVMWVGTSGGMVRYDTGSREFKIYDASSGLRSNGVIRVGKLRGKIAVGTYGGGLSLLDPQDRKWEHYNVPEGLGDPFVHDLLEDARGDIWIATGSGVNRVRAGALRDQAKWQRYTVENTRGGLPGDKVYALAEGKDDSIWLATEGGVARFRDGRWTTWSRVKEVQTAQAGRSADGATKRTAHAASTSGNEKGATAAGAADRVTTLEVDKGGRLWAGTEGAGLRSFDGAGWNDYTTADGLPSNRVTVLHADSRGRLWVGTDKGLAVLEHGNFRIMTTRHGLLSDSVYSVRTVADGGVWVGGFGGVAYLRAPSTN